MLKSTQTKFKLWAIACSPLEISHVLKSLNVSHTIQHSRVQTIVDLGYAQPYHVHVIKNLRHIKEDAINFVLMGEQQAQDLGLPFTKLRRMKSALTCPRHAYLPVIKTAEQYVNEIAKPSALNKIQTHLFTLQPYDFRKRINASVLAYFRGTLSEAKLFELCNASYKTEGLIPLIKEASKLKEGMTRLRAGEDVELIALELEVTTFDLLYLTRAK